MKMFVAFSHTLTPAQIEDAKVSLGVTEFVHLKDVAPELQAAMSQIPANTSLADIKVLANKIVNCAVSHNCKVFFCTGEPTLTMWANLLAYDFHQVVGNQIGLSLGWECPPDASLTAYPRSLKCVQSTTERKTVEVTNPDGTVTKTQVFSHVMWRDMF